ncbi:hypothetical protein [Haloarcula nitratireducens]|uniref:Nuclear receptor domain-containing protein n=1 Tax=Haloarcula nitratireducens TaxID=2487749 RepID=A0AAW4PF49_9EURY|nr:hypothetical protein [Halomicroarcula nitratireducens]MBX0296278.1 hypothetical protein [Halomicroarcula nitratireducens]
MLPSVRRNNERTSTPFGTNADRLECELCQEQGRCLDRFGIVACRSCRASFLPRPSLL